MRILLVEDEPDLGAAIKKTLEQNKYIVDWVLDGNEALNYLEDFNLEYDVAIFDWLLPNKSGIELVKILRNNKNPLPILILTAKDTMEDKVKGLDAGADDYLVKPFGMAELLARIRALSRRSSHLQPQQLKLNNLILDYATNTVNFIEESGEIKPISLTSKEFQLLEFFMTHPNQIITSDLLLDRLWEIDAEPMSNVVAAQIRLLRRKLTKSGCNKLIETVYGLGYRFIAST